jgi:SAM-dependent methyltransferase
LPPIERRRERPGDAATLARLLVRHRDADAVRRVLRAQGGPASLRRLALLDRQPAGAKAILRILASPLDSAAGDGDVEDGLERCRALFDWAHEVSPEASVAFASLGDPALLAAATAEAVALMERLGLLHPHGHVLDFGCGAGRFADALAPHVASVTGTDLSTSMIDAARRRCSRHGNVRFVAASGRDLAGLPDSGFDLVLAMDSLPYVHRAGGHALLEAMLAELHRVLRPAGEIFALNLTYRGDLAADRRDLRAMAGRVGLAVVGTRARPLRRWDGALFRLRRSG